MSLLKIWYVRSTSPIVCGVHLSDGFDVEIFQAVRRIGKRKAIYNIRVIGPNGFIIGFIPIPEHFSLRQAMNEAQKLVTEDPFMHDLLRLERTCLGLPG